jgi:hypothetical protein
VEATVQTWLKRGLIFALAGDKSGHRSHAQVPTPHPLSSDVVRVYFGVRDAMNRTQPVFVDIAAEQPTRVMREELRPLLALGELGCFDDSGVMPSSVITVNGRTLLYYTGWNTAVTVPYRNSIGLAASDDGGVTFRRMYDGPILDRCAEEPHFSALPFVMCEAGRWRMWYLSCTGWRIVAGKPEPQYFIRQTESEDGIHWRRPGSIAIEYARPDEAIARPWVTKDERGYRMWYCWRSIGGYRDDPAQSYRIGYATSADGCAWKRCDEAVDLASDEGAWDSQMQAYPAVIDIRGRRYLMYNGNGFGASGFGIAELAGAS